MDLRVTDRKLTMVSRNLSRHSLIPLLAQLLFAGHISAAPVMQLDPPLGSYLNTQNYPENTAAQTSGSNAENTATDWTAASAPSNTAFNGLRPTQFPTDNTVHADNSAAAAIKNPVSGSESSPVMPAAFQDPTAGNQSLIPPGSVPVASQSEETSDTHPQLAATIAERQKQVEGNSELATEVKEPLLKQYQDALISLTRATESETKITDWKSRIELAPKLLEVASQKKANFKEKDPGENLLFLSFEEGKNRLQQLERELAVVVERRTKLADQITSRAQRTKELPQLISTAKEELKKLEVAPEAKADVDPLIREANQWLRQAKQHAFREQVRELESQQRAYDAEAELLPIQLENAQREETDLQKRVRAVADELSRIRQDRILNKRAEIYDLGKSVNGQKDNLAVATLKQIEQWLELSKKLTDVRSEYQQSQETYERWRVRLEKMHNRVQPQTNSSSNPGFNSWVGLMLRKQKGELPNENQLHARINYFQQEMQQSDSLLVEIEDGLSEIDYLLDQTRDAAAEGEPSKTRELKLLEKCKEVLTEMRVDVNAYLTELYQAADSRDSTLSLIADYRIFINEHILWIRSCEQLDRSDLASAWEACRWLISFENWNEVGQHLLGDFFQVPWLWLIVSIAIVILIGNQPRLRRRIGLLGTRAEKKTCVQFSLTARSTLLTALISIPAPLVILFISWRLGVSSQWDVASEQTASFTKAFAKGLQTAGLAYLPMEVVRQTCRLDGLGIRHFGWDRIVCRMLAMNLRWLIDLSIPLIVVVALFSSQPDLRWEASFGRLALFALLVVLGLFAARIFAPKSGLLSFWVNNSKGGWLERLRYFWYSAILLTPFTLFVASFVGYHYTAQRLVVHLYVTGWTIAVLAIVYSMLMRWLLLNRRNLMMEQARQRLVEAAKGGGAQSAGYQDSKEVNLSTISEQTNRLVTALVVISGLISLYATWSDVLPAVAFLENFKLWTVDNAVSGETITISLANLVIVIPVIMLVVIADRNLPGLLEIAFLQHLPLSSAARYAITTLTRYAIIAIGIAVTSGALGLRWESVQWLVAALGVGLGFGLQEIFANFVSGLILLFEQPIRVGDTITIDGITGSVSKIRMRATTIINWDRQELIVPNKDLITGKLLNWTLSDSTNRIVINVGVAYGTDTTQACDLIRKVCAESPNLLREPAPIITFEGFGDHTLNLVLRGFLAALDNRLATIHGLHEQIYREFTNAGIEIAFPQRDLHIKSLPPQLSSWLSKDSKPAAGAPVSASAGFSYQAGNSTQEA